MANMMEYDKIMGSLQSLSDSTFSQMSFRGVVVTLDGQNSAYLRPQSVVFSEANGGSMGVHPYSLVVRNRATEALIGGGDLTPCPCGHNRVAAMDLPPIGALGEIAASANKYLGFGGEAAPLLLRVSILIPDGSFGEGGKFSPFQHHEPEGAPSPSFLVYEGEGFRVERPDGLDPLWEEKEMVREVVLVEGTWTIEQALAAFSAAETWAKVGPSGATVGCQGFSPGLYLVRRGGQDG